MRQGDVFWFTFGGTGSEPEGRRPALVVQHDRFNRSAINTTVVVAITSNLRLAAMPGNVRLRKGEASLPKASVVNVSQIRTVDRARFNLRVGSLTPGRLKAVLQGLALVFGIDALSLDDEG
ncbi:MAG: type II toxin-antitoxin system PemK/MazF family toxin [Polyangiales bacterium]